MIYTLAGELKNYIDTMDVVIYARVSTKTQDYDRQLSELRLSVEQKKVNEREAISELLTYCDDNHVDIVLIYECSCLSRRAVDFLQIVEYLNERNISIYIHQNGLETVFPQWRSQSYSQPCPRHPCSIQ